MAKQTGLKTGKIKEQIQQEVFKMHYGVYEGTAAAAQPKKILILGESHHGDGPEDEGKPGKYPTCKVVRDYLSQGNTTEDRLKFFNKIALAFGIDVGKDEEKKMFWDKVFFGNYVDDICGVGDCTAKNQVEKNWERYNQELVFFVNEHQIDTIFCFSILAYWRLPVSGNRREGILPCGQGKERTDTIAVDQNGKGNVYLRGYICEPMDGLFNHPVTIYGIPHPSAQGCVFEPHPFVEYLKPVFEDCCG